MNAMTMAIGVTLIIGGILGAAYLYFAPRDTTVRPPSFLVKQVNKIRKGLTKRTKILLAVGIPAGIIAWLISGVVIMIVVIPGALVWAPDLFSNKVEKRNSERLGALQKWTSGLSGLLTTGAALETALIASLRNAPKPIHKEVRQLVRRIEGRWPLSQALDGFAEALGSQEADRIIISLKLAAKERGQGLVQSLEDLASDVAEIVEISHETTAERTGPRSEARTISIFAAAGIFLLPIMPMMSAGFRTFQGQVIYFIVIVIVLLCLRAMNKTVQPSPGVRLLLDERTGS